MVSGLPLALASPIDHKLVSMNAGREIKTTKGRPIKFDQKSVTRDHRGVNGDLVVAILYESQCPFCGKRFEFPNNLKEVQCPHCKKGSDVLEHDNFQDPFCEPGAFDPFAD